MGVVCYLAESEEREVHLFFGGPRKRIQVHSRSNEAYITFYSPRVGGIPPRSQPINSVSR